MRRPPATAAPVALATHGRSGPLVADAKTVGRTQHRRTTPPGGRAGMRVQLYILVGAVCAQRRETPIYESTSTVVLARKSLRVGALGGLKSRPALAD